MTRTAIAAICTALLLAACGGREPPPEPRAEEGREETRNIRNTEAIGYAGDAIADKVDGALDANDQRKQRLDESIEGQTE
ncbi:MAG: hypothetical protein AB1651_00255 [Pseudomonadota bacterium]